ncbi:MAG TPA: tripartite tricarboxylate transporter substrate binding protein [Limnochordales bacterium]
MVAAWGVWGLLWAPALAEAPRPLPSGFPNRTIRFITWSSPGGGGDVLGRQMIEAIRRQNLLPVPVVIENRAGGSGAVAMAHVLQQPADGYTVLIVTKNLTLTPITRKLNYDYRSFKPIQRSQVEPFFVAVRANAPWKNLRELADEARRGRVTFGGAFAGSTDHLLFAMFAREAGFTLTYVPFQSGGEASTALVSGTVDVISTSPQEVAALLDAGRVRFLAVPSEKRLPAYPDLPTFREQGYDVVMEQWRGFVYHKEVPDEIVAYMDDVLRRASRDPGFQKYMQENDLVDGYLSSSQFYQLLARETELHRELLVATGVLR